MQRPELVSQILDYILTLYSAEYIGLIEVEQVDDIYTLILGIPSYMTQTRISTTASSDEAFLTFIYEELRVRNYMRLDIYKVNRTNASREE